MQPALLRAKIGLQPTPRARTQLMTNVVDRALIVEDETPPIPIVPVTAEAEIPLILADLTAAARRRQSRGLQSASPEHGRGMAKADYPATRCPYRESVRSGSPRSGAVDGRGDTAHASIRWLGIDVKGNLATMLGAANPTEDWQRQITLVAGAGFEPATFGL